MLVVSGNNTIFISGGIFINASFKFKIRGLRSRGNDNIQENKIGGIPVYSCYY